MLNLLPDFITRETPAFPPYIELKRSARAKRVSLRLNPAKRSFTLTMPRWMNEQSAYDFMIANQQWMDDQLQKLPNTVSFIDGQILPLFGQDHTLVIQPNPSAARTKITLDNKTLTVLTHSNNPAARIETYLKKIGKKRMSQIAHKKAASIDKTIRSISLRDTKSRWGSCSEDNKIMLSWRLIFAPYDAMDYVIAHEVAHLTHMDHSKAFWSLCRELSDNFIDGQYWMREHGNELLRYGQ